GDTANFIEIYNTANVGTGLTLTPSGTVNDGNGGNNYTYTFAPVSTGVITAVALTITGVTNTKVYDGTTSAAGVPAITSGVLQGSDTANFVETYSTRNVGVGLTLTPSGTVNDGNGGANYTYTFVPASTGVITIEALTITAVTNTKFYDGTTSAAAIPTVTGLKGADTVTNLSETYDSPAIGTGKTLSVSTYTVNDGNGGNNYTVTTVANQTGVILLYQVATLLVIHTEPSASATAGQPFPTQPVIYVEDQYGNLFIGDNTTQVTASLRAGVGTGPLLGTTTVTVSGGIATFTNLADDKAETILLLFTAPMLVKAQPNSTTVNPAAASTLSITAPATATTGGPFTITVTAFDPYNNIATGYRGMVNFTSSDKSASLPGRYTFTASDSGVHTFRNGVTLRTTGTQTITAKDMSNPSVTGSASVLAISPAPPSVSSSVAAIGGSNEDDPLAAELAKAGYEARPSVKLQAGRSQAETVGAAGAQRILASAVRARTIAQSDDALDHVFASLEGNLHAYVMAERLAAARLD
ncbi:MAG: YDG domain-containing protein, partial [Isosphaerales bacterium]